MTTNAKQKIPWLTWTGVPEILINNLWMTRNLYHAEVYAFCILPDHMHVVLRPGEKGLSRFIQSFKSHSMKNINMLRPPVAESRDSPLQADPISFPLSWQKGFHDEKIETDDQRENVLAYVRCNAWRHGLVNNPNDWSWSSVHFSRMIDPVEIW